MTIELVSKLFGKGLQEPKGEGKGIMVSPKPGLMPFPLQNPPPFLGTWEQQGKGKGEGASLGGKKKRLEKVF